jgi:purine-binding chemotaxis protein CheW
MNNQLNQHYGDDQATEDHQTHEYLTFILDEEVYGLDILKVQEIRGYDTVTKIANTPEFIKGVINLRGNIIPIVDLRLKFNIGAVTYDEQTVVIILNLGERIVGIVVDGVSDVVELKPEQIRQVPNIAAEIDTQYITGLATVDEKMLILVNIEKLMNSQDMALVDSLSEG